VPLYFSNWYSPTSGAGEAAGGSGPGYGGESPGHYSPQAAHRQRGPDCELNDTEGIEKSYEKLTREFRAQQEQRRQGSQRGPAVHGTDDVERRERTQGQQFEADHYRQITESSYGSQSRRNRLHAREVSFQQIGIQRGVQVRTEAVEELEGARRGAMESCKYRSNSPLRPGNNAREPGQGRGQPSGQSSGQLVRSHKSSHRSRSLDLAHLDQRSDYDQSPRKPWSLKKVDRVRHWEEQD
jgi:hypothetical protein